jgi:hypothetical protein
MGHHGFFKREPGKIGADQQLLVFDHLHRVHNLSFSE